MKEYVSPFLNVSNCLSAAENSIKLFNDAYSRFTSLSPIPYSLLLSCYHQLRIASGIVFQFHAFVCEGSSMAFWNRILSVNSAVKDAAVKMKALEGKSPYDKETIDFNDDLPF